MKLQELLKKVGSEQVFSVLGDIYPQQIHQFDGYRRAYNILCDMIPSNEEVEDYIEVYWTDKTEYVPGHVSVSNCSGDLWENCVKKEIRVDPSLNLSDQELAAYCLWEITFYGFSPQEREKTFYDMYNEIDGYIDETGEVTPVKIEDMLRWRVITEVQLIFLDIDGVLNSERYIEELRNQCKPLSDDYGYLFDPIAVDNLKKIIERTQGLIVISSSWKYLGIDEMISMWWDRKLPGKVIGVIPDALPDGITGDLEMVGKGYGVAAYLQQNKLENVKYVILDDEQDFLSSQQAHFIKVNSFCGISVEDVQQAIHRLNRVR